MCILLDATHLRGEFRYITNWNSIPSNINYNSRMDMYINHEITQQIS